MPVQGPGNAESTSRNPVCAQTAAPLARVVAAAWSGRLYAIAYACPSKPALATLRFLQAWRPRRDGDRPACQAPCPRAATGHLYDDLRFASGRRPVRPPLRARRLRRRLRRAARQRSPTHERRRPGARRRSRTSSTAAPRAPTSDTGDGAGILLQLPDAFFRAVVDFELPAAGPLRRRVCFLPRDAGAAPQARGAARAQRRASRASASLGWRDVPVDDEHVGDTANAVAPAHPPAVRRRRPGLRRRPGRLRAQALRDPPHRRARGRPRLLRPELLLAHARLQGHAHLARSSAGFYPDLQDERFDVARSRSSTRASRPTRSRAGSSRTRTG